MNLKGLKVLGFLSVVAAFLLFGVTENVSASEAHNIRGMAYNTTNGYIIFNCLDDSYVGNFIFTFPFYFNIPPCYGRSYGVNLDTNNNFSGEAWNENLGFLDFSSASSTPSDAFRSKCPTCLSGVCSACYDEENRDVLGYMLVRNTGKWIKLDGLANPTQITNYNDPDPGIFSGYATSTFGAISFNCDDANICATNNYEVKIGPLEIKKLTAPNWNGTQACSLGVNKAVLKWYRRSGVQTAYQVIVSKDNSTSTNVIYNSGQVINNLTSQLIVDGLEMDKPYYWFLRLWDGAGSSTAWRQFDTNNLDELTDNITRNNEKNPTNHNKTFTSYKHKFPQPSFTWSPEEIVIGTTSNSFVSNSKYYNDSSTLQDCTGSVCSYQWSVSESPLNYVLNPTLSSTSIMFVKATNTTITLTTTDDDIYTCSTSTILNVNYALPLWKEIKP